jgi:hypothetical protein
MKLPKRLQKDGRPYLIHRKSRPIRVDQVHPTDLRLYDGRFFCEDCSHYASSTDKCTLGYRAQHKRAEQMAIYERTGGIVFCRALEID